MSTEWLKDRTPRFLSYFRGEGYALLQSPEDSGKDDQKLTRRQEQTQTKKWSTKEVMLLLLLSLVFAGGLGFGGGFHLGCTQTKYNDYMRQLTPVSDTIGCSNLTRTDFLTPAGDVKNMSIYNRTFTEPGPRSDAAWASMFPLGVGFVRHPEISPNLSGIAMFHQIHCVNMLRVSYYAALNGSLAEMQHIQDKNKRPDPHHVRHCFDYLRQALMCAADTNLEPVDFALGGATGFGSSRTCRNFDAVKEWSERWRSWGPSIEVERQRIGKS